MMTGEHGSRSKLRHSGAVTWATVISALSATWELLQVEPLPAGDLFRWRGMSGPPPPERRRAGSTLARLVSGPADDHKSTRRSLRLQVTQREELTRGRLTISAKAEQSGDNTSEIDAGVDGDAARNAFNSKYLQDVLAVLRGRWRWRRPAPAPPASSAPSARTPKSPSHMAMPPARAATRLRRSADSRHGPVSS